ncbi:MAG TPA: methyltransferase, partial [Planctomycetota bacterium]|nr:methyltransferase [Planctomycetota bacterium]
ALCSIYDFGQARVVVDVGGGRGTLLAEVMQRWPHLRGVLLDLPHVVERARPQLVARFGARVEAHGGDFFERMTEGGDVYLVKHVLHNWDDERALSLLRCCVGAMAARGRVVAIETVLAPDNRADLAAIMDLEMQVLLGGRVRRKPELRRLFQSAGLRVEQMVGLVAGSWLLVGERGSQ